MTPRETVELATAERGQVTVATLSFTCPICGWKKDYQVTDLVEGALLECPRCKVSLTLHGHMWEEVQQQIDNIRQGRSGGS